MKLKAEGEKGWLGRGERGVYVRVRHNIMKLQWVREERETEKWQKWGEGRRRWWLWRQNKHTPVIDRH